MPDKFEKRKKDLNARWEILESLTKATGEGLTSSIKRLLGPYGIPDPYKIKNMLEKKISGRGTPLKVMTPAQMLQRLPIATAQVNAGNNSQALKNEIRQMLYSLYQAKKITKKMYEDLMSKV